MLRKSAFWLGAGLLALPAIACAQEFSADGVARNSHGQSETSKIYVEHAKVRVEPVGSPSYELLDTAQVTGHFVVPKKKLVIDQPAELAGGSVAPYDIGENPCDRMTARPGSPGPSCRKLGTEPVNGRPAEKWQVDQTVDGKHDISTMWVDRELRTAVKSQSTHGTYQLLNIHFGKQPDALFVIPDGYTHQEMGSISFTRAPAPSPAASPPKK